MKGKWGVLLILLLLAMPLSSASFGYVNNSIERTYSSGEKIKGFINISFSDEPSNSILTSNFNGSISLIELLGKNGFDEGADYFCDFPNCITAYEGSTKADKIALNEGSPEIIGFKITGEDISVISLKFDAASDIGQSCTRPLLIDVLDKNSSFIQSNRHSSSPCTEDFQGCFDSGTSDYQKANIISQQYCENITLRPAPAYKIGATVENGTKAASLNMELFDSDWNSLKRCTLPKLSQQTEKVGCIVNQSVMKTGSYFVCISSTVDDANFKIKIEENYPTCGTDSNNPPYNKDYDIYAMPIAFAPAGTISFNSDLFSQMNPEEDLANYVNSYLEERYNNNCSSTCAIPFKFEGKSQEITFANADIKYTKAGGSTVYSSSDLYKLTRKESEITTPKPLNIDFGLANFLIPLNTQQKDLSVYIGGAPVFPKALELTIIPGFSFEIYPVNVFAGQDIVFQIISLADITRAEWNFGEGVIKSSTDKLMRYRYASYNPAGYDVEVEAFRKDGTASKKSFHISVDSPRDSASKLIMQSKNNLANLSADLIGFSQFSASQIKKQINFDLINNTIDTANRTFAKSTTDEEYLNIIQSLVELSMPSSISIGEEGNKFPFIIGYSNINLEQISEISREEINASLIENVNPALTNWFTANYEGTIDYEVISGFKAGIEEPILTRIVININKRTDSSDNNPAYLIINYPKEGIEFSKDYGAKVVGSGTYIEFKESPIEFIISGEINPSELGMYLSPALENLDIGLVSGEIKKQFNWARFFFWLGLLLLIALIVYVFLQQWYKYKYEAYLFKNPNDLYNVINFIFNSRNTLSDPEIAKRLRKAGWSSEQVTYAFNKLDGKRTGMWELPGFRYFERRKINREIEKRKVAQPAPLTKITIETKPLLK